MKETRQGIVKRAKRIVVKLGSSILRGRTHTGGSVDPDSVLSAIVSSISSAASNGTEVVLVSSGSVALGMKALGVTVRPKIIPEIQAIAAVGQGKLMSRYSKLFSAEEMKCAQVLLTHDDLSGRNRFLNARNTILTLLEMQIVPVINENDTVAVDEIKFGDNDNLSALVTNLVEADMLIILTDIDGLYDGHPVRDEGSKRIALVEDVDHLDTDALCSQAGSFGTGGIASKVEAARKAAHFGIATVVASGFSPGIITDILSGEDAGTLFLPREDRLTSKKHWIAFSTRPTGRVIIDDGARTALIKGGKSLLPSGITGVDGIFEPGEAIHLIDSAGKEFARGITNYGSREIGVIKGKKTGEIEDLLGYRVYDEVIHRDNLVVL